MHNLTLRTRSCFRLMRTVFFDVMFVMCIMPCQNPFRTLAFAYIAWPEDSIASHLKVCACDSWKTMAAPRLLVYGNVCKDLHLIVSKYPEPDSKILSQEVQEALGGNGGNVAMALSKLGASVELVSSFFPDDNGRFLVKRLEDAGVGLSYADFRGGDFFQGSMTASQGAYNGNVEKFDEKLYNSAGGQGGGIGGSSGVTYIIVDREKHTRTCIHQRQSDMLLDRDKALGALEFLEKVDSSKKIVFLDSRFPETTVEVAKACCERGIFVVMVGSLRGNVDRMNSNVKITRCYLI